MRRNLFGIRVRRFSLAALLALGGGLYSGFGHDEHPASEIAERARDFLDLLTPAQLDRSVWPLLDEERFNWYFVPRARNGLSLKEMTPEQRESLENLLRSALSEQGHGKVEGIIGLEDVLAVLEGRPDRRDPELYYVSFFGRPGDVRGWGWRFEGHHLSLNFTLAGAGGVAITPSFYGANPARVPAGRPQAGLRVLAAEEDLGRELVNALTPEQRRIAVFSETAPRDIITGNDREVRLRERIGIRYADLTQEQQALFERLLQVYVGNLRSELAERHLERIRERGMDDLHFAWAGGRNPGDGHYYRIHGPIVLIEYDNTQNQANHIHSVWRDLEDDFGRDLLRQHYDAAH